MIKFNVVSVEAVDEMDELVFKVECFDNNTATVNLIQTVHTLESWTELSENVAKAIAILKLDIE